MKNELHKGATGKLFELARANRKNPTQAEKMLWDELRNRKLNGFKFRRQHPISNYIADFYCHELALVLELDGHQHQEKDQKEYDKVRTMNLNDLNIKVIRFKNEDVLYDLEGVLELVAKHLYPSPSPSKRRE